MGIARDLKPGIVLMFMGFAGLVLAAIEYVMNEQGLISAPIATLFGGVSVIMTVTVILFLLVGAIIAVATA